MISLLGQDPDRVWRAAEIGIAIGAGNLNSLRTSLAQMARAGLLTRVAGGTYRFGEESRTAA